MGTYTKIKPLGLGKLNNAEYLNFMRRFYDLAFPASPGGDSDSPSEISLLAAGGDPGITPGQKEALERELALMGDVVNQSAVSEETALMLDLDKRRDDNLVFITDTVSLMRKNPIETKRSAAVSLYNIVKPYVGSARAANQQETALIDGLLLDLAKEGVPAMVSELGLAEIVESLREANAEYARLTALRTNNKAAAIKEASASIRARVDDLYDDMSTLLFVRSVVAPTSETARLVARLNALIDETSALYKQRVGVARAAAKRKEEAADR